LGESTEFVGFCGKQMVAAPFGHAITNYLDVEAVAAEIGSARRPSVIWLQMQDCTGCTETLLRPSQPDLATLILDIISLDYHETVMAPSGKDAELALEEAMKANEGKYVLVVEGSIPTKDNGKYLKIAGKWGIDFLNEVAAKSAAVISIGSCASWGGIPSSHESTGAVGVDSIIKRRRSSTSPDVRPIRTSSSARSAIREDRNASRARRQEAAEIAYDRVIPSTAAASALRRRPLRQTVRRRSHRQGYPTGSAARPVTHASCSTRTSMKWSTWPIGVGAPSLAAPSHSSATRSRVPDRPITNRLRHLSRRGRTARQGLCDRHGHRRGRSRRRHHPRCWFVAAEVLRQAGDEGAPGNGEAEGHCHAATSSSPSGQEPPSPLRRDVGRGVVTKPAGTRGRDRDALRRDGLHWLQSPCGGLHDANNLIPDTTMSAALADAGDLNAQTKNIILLAKDGDRSSFVKRQCMHCIDPACVSGCPFRR
jgi:hydrogenase small subunit